MFMMNWVNRERHIRTQLSGFSQKQLFLNYYYIIIIYVDLEDYPIGDRVMKNWSVKLKCHSDDTKPFLLRLSHSLF